MGEICLEFGYDFRKEIQINEDNFFEQIVIKDDEKDLEKRPPIITIMGHVDHGKTTLLDTIRKTNVASNEAGGITQNIGAYQVNWKNNVITFFDTPGHEAFSSMRARGADLTDIVILVVAADDGLKPQTEEAIDHAKYAKVPIIVFINKMDKPNPNVEKVLSQLADKGVMCEEWGGNSIVVKGSALNNQGIDELLEAIILTSEMMDLKANKKRLANGVTIEAFVDKGLGPVANILVQSGTLQVGDYILVGECWGKIRKMLDSHNRDNYITLINIYKIVEDQDNILKTIKKLIDIDPNNEYNHLMLFEYYDSINDYDNAINAINKVIEVSPEEYNYLKLASYYEKIGRIDDAIATVNKLIELGIAVNDGVNYFMIGNYYKKKGDNETAKINFNKAMELDPSYKDYLENHNLDEKDEDELII